VQELFPVTSGGCIALTVQVVDSREFLKSKYFKRCYQKTEPGIFEKGVSKLRNLGFLNRM